MDYEIGRTMAFSAIGFGLCWVGGWWGMPLLLDSKDAHQRVGGGFVVATAAILAFGSFYTAVFGR